MIEVYDNYQDIGIITRKKTPGIELEMVKGFIEYRKETFHQTPENELAIFVEPKINNAYPDIIFAKYNPFLFENWNSARNAISISDLKILDYIVKHKKTTSEEIACEISVKYKDLLFSLEKLLDANLISRLNKQWVVNTPDFFGIKTIETIEAKISKWNEVLQQALLNTNFSSESSVLSMLQGEPKTEIVSMLSDFGIGIYLFNNIAFSKVSKPKRKKIPINYISLYVNECIGKILNN